MYDLLVNSKGGNYMHIVWFILAGIFLILELMTTALVSIWFVPGAVLAGIFAIFNNNWGIQIALFCIVSIIAFPISRKIYAKFLKTNPLTESDKMIGKIGKVEEPTDEFHGRINIAGVFWNAKVEHGASKIIPQNLAQVQGVDGLTLIIRQINGENTMEE